MKEDSSLILCVCVCFRCVCETIPLTVLAENKIKINVRLKRRHHCQLVMSNYNVFILLIESY